MKKEKDKALEQVLADIEKQFGKGSIMKLGEKGVRNIDVVSSGSLAAIDKLQKTIVKSNKYFFIILLRLNIHHNHIVT